MQPGSLCMLRLRYTVAPAQHTHGTRLMSYEAHGLNPLLFYLDLEVYIQDISQDSQCKRHNSATVQPTSDLCPYLLVEWLSVTRQKVQSARNCAGSPLIVNASVVGDARQVSRCILKRDVLEPQHRGLGIHHVPRPVHRQFRGVLQHPYILFKKSRGYSK